MPPYNIDIPDGGDNYTNNNRPTYGSYQMSSSSPRRKAFTSNNHRYGSNVSAPVVQQRVSRPMSDMPSTSSSGSWANELFPRSHPRHNNNNNNKPSSGGGASGGSMIHPHIRELVERQNQIKKLQRQLDNDEQQQQQQHRHAVKELYYTNNNENKNNNNVIHGLHMDHVLSNLDDNDTSFLLGDNINNNNNVPVAQPYANHPLSPHLHLDGISTNNNHQMLLPPSSHNNYEIEGTFQSKGCALQTADDVGYLFGCGTHPHDEVVYVYSSKPRQQQSEEGPPTAVADERNLFYHVGPTNNKVDSTTIKNNNVNDVLFRIDKEYHAMQARAGGGGHSEFLVRDDPPHHPQSAALPHHGQYNKVVVPDDNDDEYTKRSGCSISSLMDLLLPSKGRQSRTGSSSIPILLSPRKQDVDDRGYYADYNPTGGESRYPLLCTSPSRRKQRRSKQHSNNNNIFATSRESDEDSFTYDKLNYKRIVKTASDSVHELQTQLKAMVHERAKNKVSPSSSKNKNSYHHQVDESRQEPSPPASPTAKKNDTEKEVDRLRQEQATLDSARKLLQAELAQHQIKMANMGGTTTNNPYYNNNNGGGTMMGGVSPYSSPPMMISPMGASGQVVMGVGGSTTQQQPMMVSNPAMNMQMNGIGMNVNNGMWPQQQQQQQGMLMNNGTMGIQSQNSGMLNMMQNVTHVASPPSQVVQPQSSGLLPQQVPSNIGFGINAHDSKLIMSKSNNSFGGVNNHKTSKGKFIDNVGAGIGTTRSFLNHQGPRGGRAHLATRSYTDLKSKNESIRQDISKMKNMMNNNQGHATWDTKNSPERRRGDVRGSHSFQQQQQSGRPFPRTSPSSQGNKHWYGAGLHEEVEERIKRAMQRSDEARSARGSSSSSSNGSVASGQRYQQQQSSPRGYTSRQQLNASREDGHSRRQPPSPIRTSRQRDQDYYHV